jgi:CRP-like cAMP-binding protein
MLTKSGAEHPLARHLQSIAVLSDQSKTALACIPMRILDIEKDQDLVREGERATSSCLILEGFAVSSKTTGEGKRQIMAYHLPGDIPDLQSLHLGVLDTTLQTITPCKVGFIKHETLDKVCERHPELAKAFWKWTLIAASIFREWVLNVGQRDAKTRIAHVLCETLVRMRAIGLANGQRCEFAMTQNELADSTGVTVVHANRMLQELRSEQLVSLNGRLLEALDWDELKRAGDFDPTYLHLRDAAIAN